MSNSNHTDLELLGGTEYVSGVRGRILCGNQVTRHLTLRKHFLFEMGVHITTLDIPQEYLGVIRYAGTDIRILYSADGSDLTC